jgi:hypothetical protein
MARLTFAGLKKKAKHLNEEAKDVSNKVRKAGNQLPPDLKHRLETSLNQDLSDVKIYEDHKATLAGAKAFAQGKDIFFAPGEYQPRTESGFQLLSHEITHVVQQRAGHNSVKIPAGMSEIINEAEDIKDQ